MKRMILYPYSLMKKGRLIKLEIKARPIEVLFGYIICISISFLSVMALLILVSLTIMGGNNLTFIIMISLCLGFIAIILYVIYITNWTIRGKEIFILHPDKLEHIIKNKPYRTEVETYNFSQIDFSAVTIYDEYEDIEPDLNKVEGNYIIRFLMDEENIVYSERKIPINGIRKMKEEYFNTNLFSDFK